ncbi:hypothetical protein RE6C_05011 [Rhodopirellula europaea 6C]|uniref:Uncharacterized protein n=1 Tax=Rhodopirellula europaea 6C TaxID=1263867 RepID=M2ABU3_9BACT|nr:hypothetical protein RE6C_05011 [Rhodopirellula europaea 6C]
MKRIVSGKPGTVRFSFSAADENPGTTFLLLHDECTRCLSDTKPTPHLHGAAHPR